MYARDATSRALNVTVLISRAGHCQAQMVVREDMINSHGTCHGGMIFTLADTAFAYASNSENNATVASAASITFLRPAWEGETLRAECLERAREKRNGLYDVTVTNDDGHVVAVFQGTSRTIKGESVPGLDPERGSADISEAGVL
jgi:acyl-CoA thioesterase